MATAAPHVKLLRQLANAKDDYLSGAFDISWDGAKATIFLVFGQPSHAVFRTDTGEILGEDAIEALLASLPRVFSVSDWRRAVSPHETLHISLDELAAPFVRLAGSVGVGSLVEPTPEWWTSDDESPDLAFGVGDFPLLPRGRPLWPEAPAETVGLSGRLADLPTSIVILTGPMLRGVAIVTGGDIIDAVWVDADDQARGESAGMAMLGATSGSLAGYALDDAAIAEALTMLWRLPVSVSGIDLTWLDPASMLAAFRADGMDRVLLVDAPARGVALFSRGGLVAVYSESQRSAQASPERLRSLLSQATGRLTVLARTPKSSRAEPAEVVDAFAFFDVATLEQGAAEAADGVGVGASAGRAEPESPEAAAATGHDLGWGSVLESVPASAGSTGAETPTEAEATTITSPDTGSDEGSAAGAGTAATVVPEQDGGVKVEPASRRRWWVRGHGRRARVQATRAATEATHAAERQATQDATGAAGPGGQRPEGDGEPSPAPESAAATGWAVRQAASERHRPRDMTRGSRRDDEAEVGPAREPHAVPEAEPGHAAAEPETEAAHAQPRLDSEAAHAQPELDSEAAPAGAEVRPDDASSGGASSIAASFGDEPEGSQFIDIGEVKRELALISVVWLGEVNATPVTSLLLGARSTIDDIVGTIDTIRGLNVPGQDPSTIQAMARELHQHAAERLCGA